MRTKPLLAGATAIVALVLMATPVLADLTTISGYAYGEKVDVTITAVHVTSGPTPTAGPFSQNSSFSQNSNLANVCVFTVVATCNVLQTGALAVSTQGTVSPGSVSSTASVADVNALDGVLTGDVIASQCAVDANGATSGSTTLTNVHIQGGGAVAVNPGPNTVGNLVVSNLVVGTITLNEQTYDAGTNTLTVNAIHISLNGGSLGSGDIYISHVECDALPGGPAPVIPESPLAVLLPLSALVVAGGVLLLVFRRQLLPNGR